MVRLTSIPSVSGLWLMPRMAALEDGRPQLRIVLDVDNRQADLADEGIDLVDPLRPRRASPAASRCSCSRNMCFPVASPDLAGEIGDGDPARLLKFPLIHDFDASAWRAWFAAQDIDYRPRPQDRRFEDYNLVLDAAAHGLGIALARPPLTEDQLKSGRIVAADDARRAQPDILLARPACRAPARRRSRACPAHRGPGRTGGGKNRGFHRSRAVICGTSTLPACSAGCRPKRSRLKPILPRSELDLAGILWR